MSAPSATSPTGDRDHPDDDRDGRKRKQNPDETADERKERKRQKKARKEAEEQQRVAEEESKHARKAAHKARKKEVAAEQAAKEEAERAERLARQWQEFEELQRLAAETAARMQELRRELGGGREVVAVLDGGNECDFCRKHSFECELVAGARACRMCKLKKTKCSLLPVTRVNRRVEARNRKTGGKPESEDDGDDDDEEDDGGDDDDTDNAGHDEPPRQVTRSATRCARSDRPGPSSQRAPQTRDDALPRHVGELWTRMEHHERALWSLVEHQRWVYFWTGEMLEALRGVMEVVDSQVVDWFTEDRLPPAAYQRARRLLDDTSLDTNHYHVPEMTAEEECLAHEEYEREDWIEYADDDEEGPASTGIIVDDGWVPEDDLEPEDTGMTPPQPVVQVDPAEGAVADTGMEGMPEGPVEEGIVKAEPVELTIGGTTTGRYRVIVEEGGREVLDIQDSDDEMDVDPAEPVETGVPDGEVEGQNGQ
ncbi:hypothetical protein C8J57DRAFT_1510252 [Mycena rebaudengoi]|nr:hypothetical protein C8J57DRAFT_1510252 [Mycena rebaudengoi]